MSYSHKEEMFHYVLCREFSNVSPTKKIKCTAVQPPVLRVVPVLMSISTQTARLYREYQIVYRVSMYRGTAVLHADLCAKYTFYSIWSGFLCSSA